MKPPFHHTLHSGAFVHMVTIVGRRRIPQMSDFCCMLQLQAGGLDAKEAYSPKCVVKEFCELRLLSILGSPDAGFWIRPRNTPPRWPWAEPIHARGGGYYLRLDAYAALWMLAKLPMLIAVRGIQPGKRDPVPSPCGRCSGVGVRLQVSGPYEILQATVEIGRGSVHAEALGRCHRVHATACRGVP